jgi:hypothetical protein
VGYALIVLGFGEREGNAAHRRSVAQQDREEIMATRTWVGGGDNDARNPNDWNPTGAPQKGDTLLMPNGGTMNITNNALRGDTLQIGSAQMSAPPATLNLSQNARVSASQVASSSSQTTINVAGKDTLTFNSVFPSGPEVTVNLEPQAKLTGTFGLSFGGLLVNGGVGTNLINDQADFFNGTNAVITPDVLGIGSFRVGTAQSIQGFLEFGRSVSSGQDVTVTGDPERVRSSTLQIDQPGAFHGAVTMGPEARIDLVALDMADSYSFANDMLSIFSHNQVIDTLRLTNNGAFNGQAHDLLVSKSVNDVWVTQQGFAGPPPGSTPLPLHA